MKVVHTSLLCALTAALGLTEAPPHARAQDQWVGGRPVFQSDIEQKRRQREAKRAQHREAHPTSYPRHMKGGVKPDIAPEKPPIVYLQRKEKPNTIIIDTKGRQLYYVLPEQRAYAYPISVGRQGFTWTGTERISRIASWPSWTPPPEMRQRQPGLPISVSGGIINPLGAKALYLGNTVYRIHGTSNTRSIGRASSSGCFRMMNKHVVHLATIARVGTKVSVVSSYSGVSANMPLTTLFSKLDLDEIGAQVEAVANESSASANAQLKSLLSSLGLTDPISSKKRERR
jgi:lipoprotein-anchoring transpeptidase ErfK/SrfK